ncbi:ryncolin-1-like isoform X2 [Saccostrea cucullata]|uniref:ryncolin-1-like isoform X2 n=1 Tax=Saccostrea cuccullata TaxID=36930 RepID=UPI002ED3EBD6
MVIRHICFYAAVFALGISSKINQRKPLLPQDCQDILWSGTTDNGVYTIYPRGTGGLRVFCDMKTRGGGWTIFQKRKDGRVGFNRNWEDYTYGFGNVNGEYWLGTQRIHQLTSQGWYELRVDMSDFGGKRRYAEYRVFSVGDRSSRYKLTVEEYHGDAGDSMALVNGQPFVTKDRDRHDCSKKYKSGFWYKACHHANPNGLYLKGHHSSFADGINWYHWHGYNYSLKTIEMKIRRL